MTKAKHTPGRDRWKEQAEAMEKLKPTKPRQRRTVRVTYEGGRTITTEINGTEEEIRKYYIGQPYNFGDTDEHPADDVRKAIDVEFLA